MICAGLNLRLYCNLQEAAAAKALMEDASRTSWVHNFVRSSSNAEKPVVCFLPDITGLFVNMPGRL
jgi:hypothetical protein